LVVCSVGMMIGREVAESFGEPLTSAIHPTPY
jgi:hypothetical protein